MFRSCGKKRGRINAAAISNRYAQALADTVFAPASAVDPRQISAELHAVDEMVRRVPELKTVLLSPAVSNARKRGVINRLAASVPLSKLVRNFLYVLVDRRRADLLNDIAQAFDAAVDERQGVDSGGSKIRCPAWGRAAIGTGIGSFCGCGAKSSL